MADLTKLSYQEIRNGFEKKEFLPSDVLQAYRSRADEFQYLNVFVHDEFDTALEKAFQADQRVKNREALKILDGFPLAVKDNFSVQGMPTTACSKILKNFIPFYDSTVTKQLAEAGCLFVGMTNMDEFAMGSSTENSIYGPSINPWSCSIDSGKQYAPGGSSGGSAAAVASRMALGALGTDTGGSIRQPAAFCGLVGLKPTYGRCSRYGIIAFASSLDQAGPLTATVRDAIYLFENMSGVDRLDSTSANLPAFKFEEKNIVKGLKVGLPIEFLEICTNEEVKESWLASAKALEQMGAELKEVSLPHLNQALATYYIIAPAEVSTNLARYDGIRYGNRIEGKTLEETYSLSRSEGFGEEVKRRIMVGTYVLSSGAYEDFYLKGLKVRNLIFKEMSHAFNEVDVLLTPTTPSPPFALGEKLSNPMEMYFSDIFTVGANLSGMPALSLPTSLSKNGLPLSVQLIGNSFQENLLFNTALSLEREFEFKKILNQEIK